MHGTLALAAVTLVAAHVLTSVLDPFAPLRLADAVIPFAGRYRPVWVGLGAVAFDLLLVLVVTSLLRRRIGARAWRAVHWAAYACWPPALVHALGAGSDVRSRWMLAVAAGCLGIAVIAVAVRIALATGPGLARAGATAAVAASVLALVLWAPRGPLADGWASRAGTPAALLQPPAAAPRALRRQLDVPFAAHGRGRVRSGIAGDGTALIDITLRLRDSDAGPGHPARRAAAAGRWRARGAQPGDARACE